MIFQLSRAAWIYFFIYFLNIYILLSSWLNLLLKLVFFSEEGGLFYPILCFSLNGFIYFDCNTLFLISELLGSGLADEEEIISLNSFKFLLLGLCSLEFACFTDLIILFKCSEYFSPLPLALLCPIFPNISSWYTLFLLLSYLLVLSLSIFGWFTYMLGACIRFWVLWYAALSVWLI